MASSTAPSTSARQPALAKSDPLRRGIFESVEAQDSKAARRCRRACRRAAEDLTGLSLGCERGAAPVDDPAVIPAGSRLVARLAPSGAQRG